MSKRFGRNQRRRLREALAEQAQKINNLTTSLMMDRGLMREMSNQLRDARTFAEEVVEVLGRNATAAGEPALLSVNLHEGQSSFWMPEEVRANIASYGDFVPDVEVLRRQAMRLLEVDAVVHGARRELHCLVRLAGQEYGYCLSDLALRNMSQRELERRITPHLARSLAIAIKRAQERG